MPPGPGRAAGGSHDFVQETRQDAAGARGGPGRITVAQAQAFRGVLSVPSGEVTPRHFGLGCLKP